jgi:ferrous iron transport protein B
VLFSKIFDFGRIVQNQVGIYSDFNEEITVFSYSSCHSVGGAFPLLIAVIGMFFCGNSFVGAGILLMFLCLSFCMTMVSSKILSKTVLKGMSSSFVMEMPPLRKPQFVKTILNSIKEKVIFVLMRAVCVAAPAGLIIWLLSNINIGGTSIISYMSDTLDPIGKIMGLDGVLLLAFILGFPANEIVIPVALMTYLSSGTLSDYASLESLKTILVNNGWTVTTAICTCVFSLFHFPCSTTLLTIWKETKSVKWTLLSVLLPLCIGFILCSLINLIL